eukprot:scaffold3080_cov171-Skeletonema_dohrnii-CCMP3373.AAC.6
MSGSDEDNDDFLTDNICKVCGRESCGDLCPHISGEIARSALSVMDANEETFGGDMSSIDKLNKMSNILKGNTRHRKLCDMDCSASIPFLGQVSNQGEDNGSMGDVVTGGEPAPLYNDISGDIIEGIAILLGNEDLSDDELLNSFRDLHREAVQSGRFEVELTQLQRAVLVVDFLRLLSHRYRKEEREEAIRKIELALENYFIGINIPDGIATVFDLFVGKREDLATERARFAAFGDIWGEAFDHSLNPLEELAVFEAGGNAGDLDGGNEESEEGSDEESEMARGEEISDGNDSIWEKDDDDDNDESNVDELAFWFGSLYEEESKEGEGGRTEVSDSEEAVEVAQGNNSRRRSSRKRKSCV